MHQGIEMRDTRLLDEEKNDDFGFLHVFYVLALM